MNKEEFLEELKEIMMLDDTPAASTDLAELQEFDSMTHITLLGVFEQEFQKQIEVEDLANLKTVADLIALAGL
jgi:acyl carrier protein